MKFRFVFTLLVVLTLYTGINLYIGWHGWRFLTVQLGFQFSFMYIYWVLFGLIIFSYMIGRAASSILSYRISSYMRVVGSYWMGIMVYALFLMMIGDIIVWIFSWTDLIATTTELIVSIVVLFTLVIICLRASWNAWNPIIRKYHVQLNKLEDKVQPLKIAVVSDLHLGHIVENNYLKVLVDRINALKVDLILLPGDVIDDSVEPFIRKGMAEMLGRMNSRLGTFAVLGNHEYYGGHIDRYIKSMNEHGMNVLMDEVVLLDNQLQLVGRKDLAAENLEKDGRRKLDDLLQDLDPALPIIMMEHQPHQLGNIANAGVDVLLSGHTHRGQMMPFHWITRKLFELDWGYMRKGNLHAIVSSGFGTWGPPFRLGSRSEIIELTISFNKSS